MNAKFYPATLSGTTEAQSLKSMAMCYFTIASIANGKTQIYLKNEAEDISILKDAFSDLGVYFMRDKSVYTVSPPEQWENFYMRFDVKSSFSVLRYILPAMLTKCQRIEVSGTGKLAKKDVATGMELLKGVAFDSKTLPALVSGELKAGDYVISPEANAQLISALLIALPLLKGDSEIKFVEKPKKQTSILLEYTLLAMQEFGVRVDKTDIGFKILGGQQYIAPQKQLVVEGDFSTAGYFLGANVIGSTVSVENLNKNTLQTERSIEKYLSALQSGEDIVLKGKTNWIFLLTTLASKLDRTTEFYNVKLKEKDKEKFFELVRTLSGLGVEIIYNDERLTIKGKSQLDGGVMLDTMGDARIAMSYIILAGTFSSPVTVLSVEAGMSEQSSFLNEYIRLGGKCQVV